MSSFVPPSGPPPPKVPEGWKAVWNEQYSEWFYVNLQTKQSQWEKPTDPFASSGGAGDMTSSGGPPGYDHNSAVDTGPEKGNGAAAYGQTGAGNGSSQVDEDERLARQLQAEEEARTASAGGGAAHSYYGQSPSAQGQNPTSPSQSQLPSRDAGGEKKRGLLGKLTSKLGGGSSSKPSGYAQGFPQQQYPQRYPVPGYGGYPQQQPYGGGYGGGYGGPPPGGYYQQQQRPQRSGLGTGGGLALGAGAGLLGGVMLGEALDNNQNQAYDQGYDQGMDNGGGGGDMGGGGGDMGGGDMGGGDMGKSMAIAPILTMC